MNYQEFLLFAARRLKLKFAVVEFIVRGFLRKHHLTSKTLEYYLCWNNGHKTTRMIAQEMGISHDTVARHLQRLEFVCPELFIQGHYIPQIPWMYHPTDEEWEELERMGLIKEKFYKVNL